MRKLVIALVVVAVAAVGGIALATGPGPQAGTASSHREAPLISEDPSADNTDLYAFVSPDKPTTFTVVSNWIPAEDPAAGPNYFTFSPSARYNVNVDRNGDGKADAIFRFRFQRKAGPFFLGDTVQPYTMTELVDGKSVLTVNGTTPPDNIGPRSTPGYRGLASKAVTSFGDGGSVFAGQRDDAFFGDIGDVFDLLAIRKGIGNTGGGKDFFAGYAVHAIALQLPISQFDNTSHTIGIWASTDRPVVQVHTVKVRKGKKVVSQTRARTVWKQVSRLGNPLFNEVIVPTGMKDAWNAGTPLSDAKYVNFVKEPILAKVINQLYSLGVQETNRDDLVQVLLTGVPKLNFTGDSPLDELRLNLSIPPTAACGKGNRLGVLGGDLAGYPNGRRLEDDVIDIDEQAVAGALIGKKIPLGDGVDGGDKGCLGSFPYENDPGAGADNTKGEQKP
jgi:hypothetical protein